MVTKRLFGTLSDGTKVSIWRLESKSGAYADISEFGGVIVKLCVPDRNGQLTDVVLGYDDLDSYLVNSNYFGAIVGRNGNRIKGACFEIDGVKYLLSSNEGSNNHHSGPNGFEKKLWNASVVSDDENSLKLFRVSVDGENGFPGKFDVSVTYGLTDNDELVITYDALCDKKTIANMTNHSYFNLAGEGSGCVFDHELCINADEYTPVGNDCVPTGIYEKVNGTPMDFTIPHKIGEMSGADYQQLKITNGYDHNYVVRGYSKGKMTEAAVVWSDKTGIQMKVVSDCPCVQFYAANFVNNEHGKNGHVYNAREAFCLETQFEPNAVNTKAFHSPIIDAGEKYHSRTIYAFSIK